MMGHIRWAVKKKKTADGCFLVCQILDILETYLDDLLVISKYFCWDFLGKNPNPKIVLQLFHCHIFLLLPPVIPTRYFYHINTYVCQLGSLGLNFGFYEFDSEIDREGCIEPDNDEPQQMGDSSVEVSSSLFSFLNKPFVFLFARFMIVIILLCYCWWLCCRGQGFKFGMCRSLHCFLKVLLLIKIFSWNCATAQWNKFQ